MFYLSQRFVLKLLLVLKEGVQAVLLHDDLRLIREEDGVTVERHLELRFAQLVLRLGHEHRGCSDAWQWKSGKMIHLNHGTFCVWPAVMGIKCKEEFLYVQGNIHLQSE